MKRKLLLMLPLLLLASCSKEEKWWPCSDKFVEYYNKDYITTFIEATTQDHVEELSLIKYGFIAKSDYKRDELYTLYVGMEVSYIVEFERMHKLKELKWLVEYKFNDDYSYESVACYVPAEWRQ